MAPPPATPTPHRFLVPKRSQPHSETPKPALTPKPAFQPSGQQFQATPRFSLHSTPRPAPSSSLTPFRHRGTGRDVMIDSSPPPPPGTCHVDSDGDSRGGHDGHDANHHMRVGKKFDQLSTDYEHDSVIDEQDEVQESSPARGGHHGEHYSGNEGGRVKRRRISASPSIEEPSSLPEIEYNLDIEMGDPVLDTESSSPESSALENDMDSDKETPEDDTEISRGEPPRYQEKKSPKAHQPTFHKAPRFKPPEIPEGAPHPEPLPDAFSPRRRGTTYLPGGLAAELRDWLVDVEAGIHSGPAIGPAIGPSVKRDEEWVARIRVDSLHGENGSARGMTLVLGRQLLGKGGRTGGDGHPEGEDGGTAEVLGPNTIRLILAGPGRLSGLGVGNEVRPGALLGIARPTWEVPLDGLGRWGVACDWVVLH
ncbi:hypothetical protein SAMD00023353_3800130 [Rosellinia necatrix]|uniref:Uncharacterized protein n=1 Tax=Rosellinia necatrix TaxID=77044 RepID=A0A1W2TMD3_ROSNE|nr:hypothetical protein SAMD00023353_3800130 [Rosellinia necatrix]